MPARFLNDQDISTVQRAGMDMKTIPYLKGDRYEGLQQVKEHQPVTFHDIKHMILLFLSQVYDAVMVLIKTKDIKSLTKEQTLYLIISLLIVLVFHITLSLT